MIPHQPCDASISTEELRQAVAADKVLHMRSGRMRVVAGEAKGRKLAPVPVGTRPLSDRAREGLFSSLGTAVQGATVLDLYAGTGSLGIEALSRGASFVTFVERAQAALRALRRNLDLTEFGDRGKVVETDVRLFLRREPVQHEICFLDPPYAIAEDELGAVVKRLAEGWLSSGFTLVLHRPRRGYMPVVPVSWQIAKRLQYGDTLLALYREV